MKGDAGQHEARIRRHTAEPRHSPRWRGPIDPGLVDLDTWHPERLKRELLAREREIQSLREQLRAIHTSEAWAVLRTLSQVRQALAPRGTRRDRLARAGVRALRRIKKATARLSSHRLGHVPASGSAGSAPPEFWYDRSSSYTVLCLPIIEWSFRFQRPQQLMRQLAARGHQVLYAANQFHRGSEVKLHPLETGIVEVTLPGDSTTNVYQQLPSMEQAGRMTKALVALASTTGLRETVVLAQLPFWTALAENLRARLGWPIVYDCMDAHGGFLNNTPAVLDEEARLIATADLVIASSDRIHESVRDRSRRALLVRNGCEYDHFHSICDFSAPRAPRPVVGYYGAIADWFDSNLVAELAAWRQDWDFELIGSTLGGDVRRLEELSNIRLLGECPYPELPRMIRHWNVYIIPFKRVLLTDATNPVKVYEMLATGKPVVAVPLPELEPMAALGLVRLAADPAGFVAAIAEALAESSPQLGRRRSEYARQNTWEARTNVLREAVGELLRGRSVVSPRAIVPVEERGFGA